MKDIRPYRPVSLIRILVACAAALCIAGCMRSDIANINSRGKYVVCFGDSLTQGFGAGPRSSYPAYLSQIMSVPVVNS
ncbi:MAG TPA: hypothetical protein PLJ26_00280, partial [Candidatus Omnitrophota bacterium]|nr:hypothetical protein [Candidatus Omnitrophota bacterium]